ncbi:MAG: chromosomal replication initiator protein DnaA [Verrucomicrobiaceae bacterium]|nr:chromosomal replication initiator protein DnaA [Verrucomicrobiaceae bacterium]
MHSSHPLDPQPDIPATQLNALWTTISHDLRAELGHSTFDLWFENFQLRSLSPEEVVLVAPGTIYAIWVEENFKSSLLSSFEKHLGACGRIRFEVSVAEEEESLAAGEGTEAIAEVPAEERRQVNPRVLAETVSERKLLELGRAAGLVETFRFDNFVPGENSELAWAASRAVADLPGKTYQPLFFHSACGLGKTHLLHAIGWESLRLRPKSKIIFVTAEHFANDYIDAIQKNALVPFRKRYREADLLLIDDVQFLGRKEGLQREFFHTFNRLADRQKQIVLASDCPASEIVELEDRLVSRFQWGLGVEIHRPGLETRAAILRRKRDDWKMQISDDLINIIVERVRGNVRALEGALIRVAMVTTMSESPISPEQVVEVIADISGGQETRQVGVEEIKRTVAEHYDIDVQIINGKKRTARVAEARQIAMYLVRTLTDLSLVEVASAFAKDHGTVIYAVRKVKKRCDDSASFKSTVELIKRRLVRGGSAMESPRAVRGQYPPNPRLGANPLATGPNEV